MPASSTTGFIALLETMVASGREALRGHGDYLGTEIRENYRKQRISEVRSRARITNSDRWYLQYYEQPYMETFPLDLYRSRWSDIQDNLLLINRSGKITPNFSRNNTIWMELFTDLLAESQFRGGIPTDLQSEEMRERVLALTADDITHPDDQFINRPHIFKFGQYKYLSDTYNNGIMSFRKSSMYNDRSLNYAQRDDENFFEFTVSPVFLSEIDGHLGISGFDRENLPHGLKIALNYPREYLAWCAADRYDFKTPYAFDADAVLLITDRRRALREMATALRATSQSWLLDHGKVKYIDPYLRLDLNIDLRYTKHFRFSYQNEYRIIIEGNDLPDEYFLEVPNFSKFSKLIRLRG